MPDLPAQAEAVRCRILQPAVDLAFAHARVNCFVLAACAVTASLGLGVADDVHRVVAGTWSAWAMALDVPCFLFVAALARHLVGFQARADRGHFRVVHPLFRALETASYMMTVLVPAIGTLHVATTYLVTHSAERACWTGAGVLDASLLFLGSYAASCEWRRLPLARRREREAGHGMVPDPA